MNFSVNIHPFAQADYDHIYNYILKRSPQGAARWDEALDAAIFSLKQDPIRYARIHEPVVGKSEYKQKSFTTRRGNRYRLIYVVEGKSVTILRIRGHGQASITPRDLP